MSLLFRRRAKLILHDLEIQGLDFEFRVERSLSKTPNTAEITVYNMTEEHQQGLAELKKGVEVSLCAGYEGVDPTKPATDALLSSIGLTGDSGDPPEIFHGVLRRVKNRVENTERICHVSSGDGDDIRAAAVDFSLGPGVSLRDAILQTAKDIKADLGNLVPAILDMSGTRLPDGITVSGKAGDELDKLLARAGKTISIQNNQIQVLDKDRPLNTNFVFLSSDTGLIGSPALTEGGDNGTAKLKKGEKGRISFRSLMNAEIYPGRGIVIEAEGVSGPYRVQKATYIGDTAGIDWYVDGEAKPL